MPEEVIESTASAVTCVKNDRICDIIFQLDSSARCEKFILQRLIILMAFHRELNITPGTEHMHHRLKETAYLGG